MGSTRIKRMKWLKMLLYATVCGALLLAGRTPAAAATEAAYEYNVKRGEDKVYCGVVNTDELNVRTAAGKKNPVVQVNGKGVKLNKKDKVAILDKTSSSGETWYKVSFRMGETLVVGYVHGSYVELTKDVITPLPTITSSPTVSSESLSTSSKPTTDTKEGKSGGGILSRIDSSVLQIIGIGIVVVVTIVICRGLGTVGAAWVLAISWGISIIGYIHWGWFLPFKELKWSWSGLVFIIRVISLFFVIIIGRKDAPDDGIGDAFAVVLVISFFGALRAGLSVFTSVAEHGADFNKTAGNVCLSFVLIAVTSVIICSIFDDPDVTGGDPPRESCGNCAGCC